MLSKAEFVSQFTYELKRDYLCHNAWYAKYVRDWTKEDILTVLINAAYKLYCATATNALELTILGGTEIRTDSALVRGFGVTAANGIQDATTRKIVLDELVRRDVANKSQFINDANPAIRPQKYNRITKIGSILSEKHWSPILNDTLIIGATTAGQQFKLALTAEEQVDWHHTNGRKVNRVAVLRANFDKNECKNAWKAFFRSNIQMFFRDGTPRVFARELIGLCAFGYQPDFSWHELGFRRTKAGKKITPTFRKYLSALVDAKFQDNDREEILKTLGTFLFGDNKALTITSSNKPKVVVTA
ncbi:hypothetical protein LOC67_15355 [Stieleria sp. JC731]|uniref:hypothetical protein n=1 Tax=Pirellulaceae TaxID=2691357 RepID=UPI001E2E8659|nr:hypothetical protein [Stieleria sp. JC731]MCC9601937.1 hypothetical protein [Stieleria sp. JC731]